jgi:hypothetical protein
MLGSTYPDDARAESAPVGHKRLRPRVRSPCRVPGVARSGSLSRPATRRRSTPARPRARTSVRPIPPTSPCAPCVASSSTTGRSNCHPNHQHPGGTVALSGPTTTTPEDLLWTATSGGPRGAGQPRSGSLQAPRVLLLRSAEEFAVRVKGHRSMQQCPCGYRRLTLRRLL